MNQATQATDISARQQDLVQLVRQYLLLGYVQNTEGLCADCQLIPSSLEDLYMHKPDCLYNRLCVAVGLQSWTKEAQP